MPFIHDSKVIDHSQIFEKYSVILTTGSPAGNAGDRVVRQSDKIFGVCDKCNAPFSVAYKVLKARQSCLCAKCSSEKTREERYGDPGFRNKAKATETCLKRYGSKSVVPKGINKGIKRTQEQKDNVSQKNKIFYSDKNNHPMFGKHQSEESKEKSRQSHLKKIANGYRPPSSSKTYITGKYFSEKTNKTVKYRSSYEKWFFYMLENNVEVKDYKVEYLSIPYNFKNKSRLYIPDVFVEFKNGYKFLIEIKPLAFLNKDINLAKWESAKVWCSHNSTEFTVLTEQDMLTFILKTTSVEGILAYPEEWKQFIFKYTKSLANKFIENEVQNG